MSRPMTDAERRAGWHEHCAPLIESGETLLYGSPEHIERDAARRAEKERRKAKGLNDV